MPQGEIPLDRDSIDQLKALPQVIEMDQAHQFEHSLEVQLPFLQSVLKQFSLVPLVVGDREVKNGTVAVRSRSGEDLGSMPVEEFAQHLAEDVGRRGRNVNSVED